MEGIAARLSWPCARELRKEGSVASSEHGSLTACTCNKFKYSSMPSVRSGKLKPVCVTLFLTACWLWCDGSDHFCIHFADILPPVLLDFLFSWGIWVFPGSLWALKHISKVQRSPFLYGTLLLQHSFFCWLWWITLESWLRAEVLDVVVIEVICFCRRNVILDSFLFLDKILWVWGVPRPQVFSNFASCGNFDSLW